MAQIYYYIGFGIFWGAVLTASAWFWKFYLIKTNKKRMNNNIEDLLKDRWEVIADYPQNIMPVGSVFWMDKFYAHITAPSGAVSVQSNYYAQSPNKYPAIFKKLCWWERREESEMPGYVKVDWGGGAWRGKIGKAEFSKNNTNVTVYFNDGEDHLFHRSDTIPATEQQYTQFINQLK